MRIPSIAGFFAIVFLVGCDQTIEQPPEESEENLTRIRREIETPTGDWVGVIDYVYGEDSKLRSASYQFQTFEGFGEDSSELFPTSSFRVYEVSSDGKLELQSEVITDLDTGEPVKRKFFEPKIEHWMTLDEVPEELRGTTEALAE